MGLDYAYSFASLSCCGCRQECGLWVWRYYLAISLHGGGRRRCIRVVDWPGAVCGLGGSLLTFQIGGDLVGVLVERHHHGCVPAGVAGLQVRSGGHQHHADVAAVLLGGDVEGRLSPGRIGTGG